MECARFWARLAADIVLPRLPRPNLHRTRRAVYKAACARGCSCSVPLSSTMQTPLRVMQGGVQGRVRSWVQLEDVILFSMRDNRWCGNVGR